MSEQKYTIAEDFELPSKGLIYGKNINPTIKLRSMTTMEEMKITAPSNNQYKNLAECIESCMVDKLPISVYDMCIGDYEYLLHKMRVVTYGPDYKMVSICPYCETVEEATINLDDIEVLDFDINKFKEASTVYLEKSDKEITLRYQTPRMLDSIKKKCNDVRKNKPEDKLNYEIYYTLEESIDLVGGVKLNYADKENFIKKLPLKDTKKLKHAIDKLNNLVGLKNDVKYICKECGKEVHTSFRFGPEFFDPTED